MTAPIGESPNASAALNQALGVAPQKPPSDQLDKDAFLKLLVAQLKYQDPMNPAQGTEFVAQTAQFTMVEKLSDLAEVQQQMLTAQLTLGAASLLGKEVTYTDAAGNAVSGKVEGATLGTTPSVTVNGLSIPMSSVTAVGKVGVSPTTTPVGGAESGTFTPIGDAIPGATTPPGTFPPAAPMPGATTPGTTTPTAGAPTAGAPAAGAPAAPAAAAPAAAAPAAAAVPRGTAPVAGTGPATGTTTGSPTPTTVSPTTPPGPTTPGTAPDATTSGA